MEQTEAVRNLVIRVPWGEENGPFVVYGDVSVVVENTSPRTQFSSDQLELREEYDKQYDRRNAAILRRNAADEAFKKACAELVTAEAMLECARRDCVAAGVLV